MSTDMPARLIDQLQLGIPIGKKTYTVIAPARAGGFRVPCRKCGRKVDPALNRTVLCRKCLRKTAVAVRRAQKKRRIREAQEKKKHGKKE